MDSLSPVASSGVEVEYNSKNGFKTLLISKGKCEATSLNNILTWHGRLLLLRLEATSEYAALHWLCIIWTGQEVVKEQVSTLDSSILLPF